MARTAQKLVARVKRKIRVRKKVLGTNERPRLSVFKSARHIYAQLIDDTAGVTLGACSTLSTSASALGAKGNVEAAVHVGKEIAKIAHDNHISAVVFDRNGFLYHGRIKALADAARESGLLF